MRAPKSIEEAGGTVHWTTLPDGMRIRYAVLEAGTAKPAGALLFLAGYSEFIEKNLETLMEWAECGYRVLTLDWPGQGLSERFLRDRQKGHVPHFQYHLDALSHVIADAGFHQWTGRKLIMGHSMGGHLALRFARDQGASFERLIAVAPMIDIHVGAWPRAIASLIVHAAMAFGARERFLIGTGPRLTEKMVFEGNPLTSDSDRFERMLDYMRDDPDLVIGGPSFGWVAEALRSINELLTPAFAKDITLPVLMISAGADTVVENPAQARLAPMLPDCQFVTIEDARHEILCETDSIRAQFWHYVDAFMQVD